MGSGRNGLGASHAALFLGLFGLAALGCGGGSSDGSGSPAGGSGGGSGLGGAAGSATGGSSGGGGAAGSGGAAGGGAQIEFVAKVDLPGVPGAIASDPVSGLAYVALDNLPPEPTLAVVDFVNGTLVKSATVGDGFLSSVALDVPDGKIYASNGSEITVIDLTTLTESGTVGFPASHVATSPAEHRVYGLASGSLAVVDTTTATVEGTFPVAGLDASYGGALAASPSIQRVFAMGQNDEAGTGTRVGVLDTTNLTLLPPIDLTDSPTTNNGILAASPDNKVVAAITAGGQDGPYTLHDLDPTSLPMQDGFEYVGAKVTQGAAGTDVFIDVFAIHKDTGALTVISYVRGPGAVTFFQSSMSNETMKDFEVGGSLADYAGDQSLRILAEKGYSFDSTQSPEKALNILKVPPHSSP